MSGAGLIELLAARLGGRGARRAAPALREALAEVSARGANQSDPLVTVYRGGGDGQFWTPNAETAAGYGPVRRGMLDTNGFGSAEYTAEMADQSDDFGAFIQNQMARAESENLPGVTLDGIPDLPNWDIQRQYIVRDPSRLRDIAEHGPASEAAPSLRDALSRINAARTGPDAGPAQGGRRLADEPPEVRDRTGIIDRVRGDRLYETPNASVSIWQRDRNWREVRWDLRGNAPDSIADRARIEQEGVRAAMDALRRDAATQGANVKYYVSADTPALARRYRRMAEQYAPEAGFSVRETSSGGLLFERNAGRTAPDGGSARIGQLRSEGFDTDTRLYHGTDRDFDRFEVSGRIQRGTRDHEIGGAWFTSDPERAASYASNPHRGAAEGANTRPVFVRLRNPLEVTIREPGDYKAQIDAVTPARIRELQAQGYDGIRFHFDSDGPFGTQQRNGEVVVFDPDNIRGALSDGPSRTGPNARSPADGGPVQAERPTFNVVNDSFTVDAPYGQVRGRLDWNGPIKVDSSAVPESARGQGNGVRLYEEVLEQARARGVDVVSDYRVSVDAARVYDSLARRGYQVERNPTATLRGKNWVSGDGEPVFRVNPSRTAPNAGSDRNALQRALRERMERGE